MSLNGEKARLTALATELDGKWNDTQNAWRDAKGEEFQKEHLDKLFPEIDKAVTAIEKLDELLKRVRNDCE